MQSIAIEQRVPTVLQEVCRVWHADFLSMLSKQKFTKIVCVFVKKNLMGVRWGLCICECMSVSVFEGGWGLAMCVRDCVCI